MLASLLSLLGEGFEGSLAALPLAGTAASAPAAAGTTERLFCSSLRGSGLGCVGRACSAGGWTVSSCCSLWLCRRRSWTRSSKIASCSSWMAWFRCVFLFYVAIKTKAVVWQYLQRKYLFYNDHIFRQKTCSERKSHLKWVSILYKLNILKGEFTPKSKIHVFLLSTVVLLIHLNSPGFEGIGKRDVCLVLYTMEKDGTRLAMFNVPKIHLKISTPLSLFQDMAKLTLQLTPKKIQKKNSTTG